MGETNSACSALASYGRVQNMNGGISVGWFTDEIEAGRQYLSRFAGLKLGSKGKKITLEDLQRFYNEFQKLDEEDWFYLPILFLGDAEDRQVRKDKADAEILRWDGDQDYQDGQDGQDQDNQDDPFKANGFKGRDDFYEGLTYDFSPPEDNVFLIIHSLRHR